MDCMGIIFSVQVLSVFKRPRGIKSFRPYSSLSTYSMYSSYFPLDLR